MAVLFFVLPSRSETAEYYLSSVVQTGAPQVKNKELIYTKDLVFRKAPVAAYCS